MEAKFKYKDWVVIIFTISVIAAVISGIMWAVAKVEENLSAMIIYGLLTLIISACAVVFGNLHGCIIADDEKVIVISTLFGKEITRKNIEYSKIECVKCGVETIYERANSHYNMFFKLKLKGGSEIPVFIRLNIGIGFPAQQPDKYKQYLSEQPLMQLSQYIDKKLHLNTSL